MFQYSILVSRCILLCLLHSDIQVRKEEVKEQVREDILDSVVDCYLTETETIWLLDIPAVSVSVDSEDAEAVKWVTFMVFFPSNTLSMTFDLFDIEFIAN